MNLKIPSCPIYICKQVLKFDTCMCRVVADDVYDSNTATIMSSHAVLLTGLYYIYLANIFSMFLEYKACWDLPKHFSCRVQSFAHFRRAILPVGVVSETLNPTPLIEIMTLSMELSTENV